MKLLNFKLPVWDTRIKKEPVTFWSVARSASKRYLFKSVFEDFFCEKNDTKSNERWIGNLHQEPQ